ncbi:D-ribose pyranase [Brachyspira sp.]|uniref:D-ribose pyranase n=1 Tax=Brachyspira sp. TaxID=1977261 RepID=UPI002630AE02|nr:D-ribose pyranase [Brachyspira sp.]
MKKNGIVNSDISSVLSYMRHTDLICISDLGLPCPDNVNTIDISLKFGVPSFVDVLKEVINDMKVESIILAEEIKSNNADVHNEILSIFGKDVSVQYISHSDFKKKTSNCKAIIRTGENTPYSNIIIKSACIF